MAHNFYALETILGLFPKTNFFKKLYVIAGRG
jgi:hypothetical protein